jgi:SAM-dependent methyltransferase
VLRPGYAAGWRLVNLAKDPADPAAAPAAITLAVSALKLADRVGVDTVARVDTGQTRLLAAYTRRGYRIIGSDENAVLIYRTASHGGRVRSDRRWRGVLRTGRLNLPAWQARFGSAGGPFLDLGAGDSPLSPQLAAEDVVVVSLDPGYLIRPPTYGGVAVAGLAEHLPFRAGSFATVNANFVMQHVARPRLALMECLRTVRQGGRLVLHPVWAKRSVRHGLDRLPGVRILPGQLLPPGRQRPSMIVSPDEFDIAAHGARVAAALTPHPVIGWLGRVAMRLVIHLGGQEPWP